MPKHTMTLTVDQARRDSPYRLQRSGSKQRKSVKMERDQDLGHYVNLRSGQSH